jgi:hypothetical protein
VATGDGSRTVVVIVLDGVELTTVELVPGPVDLGVVDALARLQLAARRLGGELLLRHPDPELVGLLELVGLAGVLAVEAGAAGEALEAGGQTEGLEESGVEEVVELRDPTL